MSEEVVLVRMQSPPMKFWDSITIAQWDAMSDEKQDEIIELATGILKDEALHPEENI